MCCNFNTFFKHFAECIAQKKPVEYYCQKFVKCPNFLRSFSSRSETSMDRISVRIQWKTKKKTLWACTKVSVAICTYIKFVQLCFKSARKKNSSSCIMPRFVTFTPIKQIPTCWYYSHLFAPFLHVGRRRRRRRGKKRFFSFTCTADSKKRRRKNGRWRMLIRDLYFAFSLSLCLV